MRSQFRKPSFWAGRPKYRNVPEYLTPRHALTFPFLTSESHLEMGMRFGCGVSLLALFLAFASVAVTSRAATKIVGGSDRWKWGVNYTDWALKNGPFYVKDTLVFFYDPPTNSTFPHSVSLLRDYKSFTACDFNGSVLVGNIMQGTGKGYRFVLRQRKTHYFACGEHGYTHCSVGQMKFSVKPIKRSCKDPQS
ncbi:hypothetical protein ACLOJK_013593 [Asimina triloba]